MKNNIQVVFAYGNSKNQVKESNKRYKTVFDKNEDKYFFFECHLESPVGYQGSLDVSYDIYSGNSKLPTYRGTLDVSPRTNIITVGLRVVNSLGEHIINGEYTAIIRIGNSDPYYFDFIITGDVPKRFVATDM